MKNKPTEEMTLKELKKWAFYSNKGRSLQSALSTKQEAKAIRKKQGH